MLFLNYFRYFIFFCLINFSGIFCCLPLNFLAAHDEHSNLMQDLMIVNYWSQRQAEKFPVTYNHLLQGGYFSMPSARMGQEGETAGGYGYIPPYIHYSVRFQLVDFLEVTGNYRIFKGVADPVLTHHGFGDFSDKGANVKLSLFSPEASRYKLPGFAIGFEDFLGTRAFKAFYFVATQVFLDQNVELSLGFGTDRIRGLFGGMSWMPFRHYQWKYLRSLAFVLEYDAIPYHDQTIEKHPKGRHKFTHWHLGVKYRLLDNIDLSLAYIRGEKLAFTLSTFYNFGMTKGIIPKFQDPLPYRAPVINQPIDGLRPEDVVAQEFFYAMRHQGFEVREIWLSYRENKKILRFKVTNALYREEKEMRTRLQSVLGALAPDNVDIIIVTLDIITIPIQEVTYQTEFLRRFRQQEMGRYELDLVSPWHEVTYINPYESKLLFKQRAEWYNIEVMPKTQTLFGSALGKFKYALGLSLGINGFLFDNIYYSTKFGYFALSDLHHISDFDILNPSQIINVRSDSINYFKQKSITIDEAYAEKIWNWGKGWYTRLSLGLFEQMYGGVAVEWLYYPVGSDFAIGMDLALLKKRHPEGIGFTNEIRKLKGFHPTYRKYTATQFFLNLYYNWRPADLQFKMSIGRFLAYDIGVRTEVSRYFPSGLQLGFWYTYTNGKDRINNSIYHDKGLFFSIPLDIFYTKTSRSRWGYGMAAWLRDVGARAFTGAEIHYLIDQERL
jgi:Exopolysaccharide biosynthesis protein YbjH